MGGKNFISRDKFKENTAVDIEQQALAFGQILKSDKAFRSRVGLYTGDTRADEFLEIVAIRLKIDPTVHKNAVIGKNLAHAALPAGLEQALIIHFHPGRNTGDQPHISLKRLFDNFVELSFPVIDTIGRIRRKLVGAQPGRHQMVDDA